MKEVLKNIVLSNIRAMKFKKYESRFKAGRIVANFLDIQNQHLFNLIINNPNDYFCYAIPNGGVPVTEGFCSKFKIKYDICIVRKIKIPNNPEAGFGSITSDGTVLINDTLLKRLNLSDNQIQKSIKITREEIRNRLEFYGKKLNFDKIYRKNIQNRNIIILDDGIGSGFTMLAAINMIKRYEPNKIIVIVPTAPLGTIKKIMKEVNDVFCPNIKEGIWFAVADAYKNWYDVSENEVLELLNNSEYYISNLKK